MQNDEIIFKIGIKFLKKALSEEDIEEIGAFLAEDIRNIYDNGEDFIETEYLGYEIYENLRLST